MKFSARLLALGLFAASLNLVALADEKAPTPPDFSYNFLNIPLSTAEPPKADPLPLPDLSKNYSQVNPKPVKTTPIATEETKPAPEVKPEAKPEVKAEASKPEITVPEVKVSETPSTPETSTTKASEKQPEVLNKAQPATPAATETPVTPPASVLTTTAAAPSTIEATVGTGFSSILNEKGDTVKVFLNSAATLPNGQILPAGTQLIGKIEEIKRNRKRDPQDMKIVFTQATPPLSSPIAIQATPDTPDGVITPGNDVIGLKESHSYESIKGELAKTLGADQSVYNQRLKVNSSQTGDYRKDAFIQKFHKNAVLVGSGDQLRLKFTP